MAMREELEELEADLCTRDFIGKVCAVHVDAQAIGHDKTYFIATLKCAMRMGRDFFFVFVSEGDKPLRSIIKSSAVLAIREYVKPAWAVDEGSK
jgi:hypothetical protein